MKSYTYFLLILFAAIAAAASTALAETTETLTLDRYLDQVKDGHAGYKAAKQSAEGAVLTSREGELLLAPTIFASAQYQNDDRNNVLFGTDRLRNINYSLGVSHQATFGLKSKLSYNLLTYDYAFLPGAVFGNALSKIQDYQNNFKYSEGSLTLDVSLPLWKNFFGRETRAQQEQLEAQSLANHYLQSYQGKTILSQAEAAYWELALRRQVRLISEDNLSRAKKILDWNQRRATLQLGDKADLYQSEANVEQRKLDLQTATDSERVAALTFNSLRGVRSEQVTEPLIALDSKQVEHIKIPDRVEMPEDLKAAQQQERAGVANGQLGIDRDSPTLELYGQVATLGRNGLVSNSLAQAFSISQPLTQVGVRFQAPIDIPVTWDARDGWRVQKIAAETAYQRRAFEKEREWADLSRQLSEAKHRLELARNVETVQKKKYDYERDRLTRGRTTTYNVLLIEQDYRLAQLSHIQTQASILGLVARMKLFSN